MDLAFTIEFIIIFYEDLFVYFNTIVFNKSGMMKVLAYFDKLVEPDNTQISGLRRSILEKSLKNALFFAKSVIGFIMFLQILIVLYNLNHTGFSSPMMFTIPGIPRESIFFYPTNVISQVVLYYATVPMIVVSDVVIMIVIMYFDGQLSAITEVLVQLEDESVAQEKGGDIIRLIHKEHTEMLEKFEEVNKSLWHTYFHKLVAGLLYICFTMFTVQSIKESFILAVMIVQGVLVLMYTLCYFGQIIRNASEDMSKALYMSKWYEMQGKDQKHFLMLMMKFRYPLELETFGFGTVSVYTFVQICKAGISYTTMIYTLFY
ncbi:hypothetical protein DMENIID0001_014340 [Sergentomyia squamirostris]